MFMRVALPVEMFAKFSALAGLTLVFALQLSAAPALAQGSTGGSIGKQDKSISGDQDGGGSRSTSRERERPSKSERSSSRSRSGSGGGNFDGTWNGASFGRTCSDKTAGVVVISGSRMAGDGFSGTVTGSGSVSGLWAGSGLSATVSGRISGSSGSGSFRRSDGCVGTWTLVKQ
jgi:hypothetical protein